MFSFLLFPFLQGQQIYVWYGSTAHYSLVLMLREMNIKVVPDTEYMRGADCTLTPCHFEEDPNAITLIGRTQAEILQLWNKGVATAVYLGLPELNIVKNNGTILMTNKLTTQWERPTFTGLLGATAFLDKVDPKYATYNVDTFIQQFILEMAKANYYYENNTKEFGVKYVLDTIGTSRVSGSIASVTGGKDEEEVYSQLILRRYPSMTQQLTCDWMGCGNQSRVAWALKDMSIFLKGIKEDWNVKSGLSVSLTQRDTKPWLQSTSDIRSVALAELKDNYDPYVDARYMTDIMAAGQDGTYMLSTGSYVHLGYEIMAMFGPTRSHLIS